MYYTRFVVILLFGVLFGAVSCLPEGRIVNGTATTIEKFPFMVSLRNSNGSHICGGSIIRPSWILTAAYCLKSMAASELSIQYASTEVNAKSANVLKVKRFIIHENYTVGGNFPNDIALLELYGRLAYNYRTIAPITLPTPYFEIPQRREGVPGVLAGWGRFESTGSSPTNLHNVNLKIYSDIECNQRHDNVTTVDQICGGVDGGGKGQCRADDGGPLVYKGRIQVGIASWSVAPCMSNAFPGVYTKVSHYVEWIQKHIDFKRW